MDFAERLGKLLEQWSRLIVLVGGVLAALVGLKAEVLKWDPFAWSWRELVFVTGVVVLIAVLTVRSRTARASRLIEPDALKLDPRSPEQLAGRGEDLARLLNALSNPLVFLVSESGCGKSALLRAGVAQDPAFAARFLPIYIDMSAQDWEDGPRRALREAFSHALPADDPARPALDAKSGQDRYADVFSEYRKRTQRRPLVLLDQFDDYQADPRHRDRFLPRNTRVWRNAENIVRENAFWRVLRQCLKGDAISIVVACRDDAAAGLHSIQFQHLEPLFFDLPRLERGLVRKIVENLTNRPADKPQVVASPDGGWTALRDRLEDDLEARGEILPQQLKIVLGGLRTLRRLTPAAYSRVGRLAGLQAAFIDSAIRRAALVSALRYEDVLRLVLALVDRQRQPPDKAAPLSLAGLTAVVGAPLDVTARALKRLEADEVVRPRADADGETISWQLDHAYLAQPILHLERERDKWRRLLEERAHAYAEAVWQRKWAALLPMWTQAELAVARLQGRFRYGEQRAYALKSLARGMPAIAAAGSIAAAAWAADEYEAAGQIEVQLAEASWSYAWTDDAASGLTNLMMRGPVARWRVASDLLSDPVRSGWFTQQPEPIVRALVGLDRNRLNSLLDTYLTPQALRHPDARIRGARHTLAVVALPDGDPRIPAVLTALRDTGDLIPTLTTTFIPVVEKLKVGDSHLADVLAALHKAACDPAIPVQTYDLSRSARLYAAAARTGNAAHVADVLDAVSDMISNGADNIYVGATDRSQRDELVRIACAVMADRPGSGSPHIDMLGLLRDAIIKKPGLPGDYFLGRTDLASSSSAYVAAARELTEGDPRAANELVALRNAIDRTADEGSAIGDPYSTSGKIKSLAKAYAEMAAKLGAGASTVNSELDSWHDTIVKRRSPVMVAPYSAVAARLKEGDPRVGNELAWLRGVIASAAGDGDWTVNWLHTDLAKAYATLAPKLNVGDPHVENELDWLHDACNVRNIGGIFPDASTNGFVDLAGAYAAMIRKQNLRGSQMAELTAMLRHAIDNETVPDLLHYWSLAYANTVGPARLKDSDAAEVLAKLRDAIGRQDNSNNTLSNLAQAYAAVAAKADGGDPHIADILAVVRKAFDNDSSTLLGAGPSQLIDTYLMLAEAMRVGDPGVADELAAAWRAFAISFRAISGRTDGYVVSRRAFAVLAAKLPAGDPHVASELAALRREMAAIPDQLADLHGTYGVKLANLTGVYEEIAARQRRDDPRVVDELAALRAAIGKETESPKLAAYASAYAATARVVRLPKPPMQDISILLRQLPLLRVSRDAVAFSDAIKEAAKLGNSPLPWDKVGLVYTAALLQPTFAGEATRKLVADYEQLIRERPEAPKPAESWNGDLWAFAKWAKDNLPGFDPHRPNVAFLSD